MLAPNWGWTAIVLLLLPATTTASRLLVPTDHPTIQQAVDHAEDGDTVLVAPGVYHENVRIRGKAVALVSHFVFDDDPEIIAQTVIDGSSPSHPDSGSTVFFGGVNTPGAALCGFTIRGGNGTKFNAEGTTLREGGGVLVRNQTLGTATVTLRNNVFRDNVVRRMGAAYAGGAGLSTWFTSVEVERNVFLENQGEQYAGAVICNRGPLLARNNLFVANRQEYGNPFDGAALFFYFGWTAEPFENNTFVDHQVVDGGPSSIVEAYGATAIVVLRNNVFDESVPLSSTSAGGQVTIAHSLIPSPGPGGGNVVGVPDFLDAQFVLQPTSPGVDAGSSDGQDIEDPESPGSAMFPARGTIARDMGVYGGPDMPPLGFPILDGAASVGDEGAPGMRSLGLRIGGAQPVLDRSWIEVETVRPGFLEVQILDALGRQVRTLATGVRGPGVHRIEVAPRSVGLQAGVYFVRASGPGQSARTKLVVLK
ncbi:MAG: hypothetical protein IPK72_00475 [Candidatus Eisenbacteria bacterium]|nr:hypothetical protein [Candidatus Eisenbacteria bacterium]